MKWLENMILQTKLIMLTGIMVVAMMTLGWMGFTATQGWQSDIIEIGDVRVPSLISAAMIRNAVQNVVIQQTRVRGLKEHPKRREALADASQQLQAAYDRLETGLAMYKQLPHTPKEVVELNKFEKVYPEWRKRGLTFKADVIDKLSKIDDPDAADFNEMTTFIESIRELRKEIMTALQGIYDINKEVIDETNKNAKEKSGPFVILCQSGKIKNTQGMTYENRSRCRAICS